MKQSSNKTNKLLLVLVIVLSIVVLVETTLLCSTLLVKKSPPKEEIKEIIDKEVKDIDDITDLSIKIDTLLSQKTNNYYKSNSTSAYGFRFQVLKSDLTDYVKQEILLDSVVWEEIPSSTYDTLKET